MLHFATFCHNGFLTLISSDFLICQYLPLNANVKFMPLFAAVCLSHILPMFASLRQYKICCTFCCSLIVFHFANICHLKAIARIFFNFVLLFDPVCHNICAIGKKQHKSGCHLLPFATAGILWLPLY